MTQQMEKGTVSGTESQTNLCQIPAEEKGVNRRNSRERLHDIFCRQLGPTGLMMCWMEL